MSAAIDKTVDLRTTCPHCRSKGVYADPDGGDELWQTYGCMACGKSWPVLVLGMDRTVTDASQS